MKQFSCHIITIILLASGISLFQDFTYAATDIEIHGQIGRNETIPQSPNKPETDSETKLAQPKQNHIELKKLPKAGSVIEKLTPIGLMLLFIYLLLYTWKAHRNKRAG
ncbi:hypothetical protein [Enterococcus ureasiticus]|uniref:Gram-positive cocci surface proteins LPxTG domain-containing protein n=1 Tax=Enterococcus ureasiticus TaxID=903984 RepID=A0A1E5GGA9_9ENTE|nr:hypothetical protein [Enterococcus ureasiticus]OEG11687.1 hypothetical protein BCR21_10395 [Enterococcus ureasiticus]